jgi:hypothetical protein
MREGGKEGRKDMREGRKVMKDEGREEGRS